MASSKLLHFALTLLLTLLSSRLILSSDAPELSPSPAPVSGSDDSPTPSVGSPPALPPSDLPPAPASTPLLGPPPFPAPAPAPEEDSDTTGANVKSEEPKDSSSGGMSGGKKAGIAIGVIGAACVAGFGVMLYKKRQQNIQRAQFGYAARREFL